jgi:hypothetical protein
VIQPVKGEVTVPRRKRWIAALIGVAVASAIAAVALLRFSGPAPLAVIPARWVWADTAGLDPSDERLAEAITAQLVKQGRGRVIGWPELARLQRSFGDLRSAADKLGTREVAVVSSRWELGRLRVTVFLMAAATGEKGWVRIFSWIAPIPL